MKPKELIEQAESKCNNSIPSNWDACVKLKAYKEMQEACLKEIDEFIYDMEFAEYNDVDRRIDRIMTLKQKIKGE